MASRSSPPKKTPRVAATTSAASTKPAKPAKPAARKATSQKAPATPAKQATTTTKAPAQAQAQAPAQAQAQATLKATTTKAPAARQAVTPMGARVAQGARSAAAVWASAEEDFARGRWRQALAGAAGVVVALPTHLRARLRVGDALLNLGMQREALEVYQTVAATASRMGAPLVALVALKVAALLDPETDASGALADYARGSERLDALLPQPALAVADAEPTMSLSDDLTLVAAATAIATTPPKVSLRPSVPSIPLFSYLDEDDFLEALGCVRVRRFSDGDAIISQGERNESVYIIADGEVTIERDDDHDGEAVTLARLRAGAVFGELALISDEPRQASAIAVGDVDLLEVRRSDLIVAAAQLPGLSEALRLFTRERFLRNLTATHPFFAPLGRNDRHRILEVTRVLTFQAGDVLIQEGQRGPGLFVLLGGAASVKKAQPERAGEPPAFIHLATLRGGDLCGDMSMLTDAPTNATVTCTADMETLFLSRDAFKAVTAEHPELLRYLAGVTDDRLRKNRALLHGRTQLEDDEQVMI